MPTMLPSAARQTCDPNVSCWSGERDTDRLTIRAYGRAELERMYVRLQLVHAPPLIVMSCYRKVDNTDNLLLQQSVVDTKNHL